MKNVRQEKLLQIISEEAIETQAVSYTHLDVYKRQAPRAPARARVRFP